MFRDVGDKRGVTVVLCALGHLARDHGEWRQAVTYYGECLELARTAYDLPGLRDASEGLACIARAQAHAERAAVLFGSAPAIREAMGTPVPLADKLEYDEHVAALRQQLTTERYEQAWAKGQATPLDQIMADTDFTAA
jgi:hypothetical protein